MQSSEGAKGISQLPSGTKPAVLRLLPFQGSPPILPCYNNDQNHDDSHWPSTLQFLKFDPQSISFSLSEKLLCSSTEPPSWGSKFFSGRRLQLLFTLQEILQSPGFIAENTQIWLCKHVKMLTKGKDIHTLAMLLTALDCELSHWTLCHRTKGPVLAAKTMLSSPSISGTFPTHVFTLPSMGSPNSFSSL